MRDFPDGAALDLDIIFHLLRDNERRYALYYLLEQNRPVPLEELVEQVLMWTETVVPDAHHNRQEIRETTVEMHLPECQEYGVLTSDPDTQLIETYEGFPVLTALLQRAEQYELFNRPRETGGQ